MASFGSAQKQLLQTNQLNVIGSVKKSYDISGLEEFLANEGAIPFIELARQYIIQSDRKSTRLNSSHSQQSRMPSSA